MRCPKCQYISFGPENRCRNCGFDFSLASESEPLDLPIQNGRDAIGPMADLPLGAAAPKHDAQEPHRAADGAGSQTRPTTRPDLPLFEVAAADDAPLVTPSAVPRAPLSVRRAPPIITRPREQSSFDEDFLSEDAIARARLDAGAGTPREADDEAPSPVAPSTGRLLAGLFDVALMAGIDVAVIYLTLRLCNLEFSDIRLLPAMPTIAFFLLLNGGYLVLFTAAGGQTIGKMATGIRVVPEMEPAMRVPFGTAVLRAAAFAASLLPAGLGLLPILFSPDGRALHDRLSSTRVVKA